MKSSLVAVDTNVLVYLHDNSDERKRSIAKNILAERPKIASQVISEYLNVTRRILALPKADIVIQCANLLNGCPITPISANTLISAATLIEKYGFQIFDAVIVAAALEADCTVLYSEDMQHGFKVESLTILNPFI